MTKIINVVTRDRDNGKIIRKKDRDTYDKNAYPRTFGCPFCSQEFALMSSVFNHMSKTHYPENSQDLFSWDDVPGNDNGRLIEFLKQNYGIDWVKTAKIEKIDDCRTIRVSYEKNYLFLGLNDNKTLVNIKIDDGRTEKLSVRLENSKLNIYNSQNNKVWRI